MNSCIYILSYDNPTHIKTLNTLEKSDNKLPIYIVVESDTKYLAEYKKQDYNLIVFDRNDVQVDLMDNFADKTGTLLQKRAFIFEHAKQHGIDSFIMLDDDYDTFCYRIIQNNVLKEIRIKNITKLFKTILKSLDNFNGNIQIAFSQNGEYIGGKDSAIIRKHGKYKLMNVFFCKTDYPIPFMGRFNDDVNGYLKLGLNGQIPFSLPYLSIHQSETQKDDNGLTRLYKKYGTYVKSFYSIILNPASVKIRVMGDNYGRLHHFIPQTELCPRILEEKYKK